MLAVVKMVMVIVVVMAGESKDTTDDGQQTS